MLTEVVRLELFIWHIYMYWPKTTNPYLRWLYNFGTLLVFIFNGILYPTAMVISAIHASNLDELSESLYMSITLIAMIPKYLTAIINRGRIRRLLELLSSNQLVQKGDENVNELIRKSINSGKKNTYIIMSIGACTVSLMFLAPLMEHNERKLPYRASYGIDHTVSPWYEFLYLYQVVGMIMHYMMNVALDTLPCSTLAVAGGQLDVLAYYIRHLGAPGSNPEHQHAKLERYIKLHLVIVKLVDDVEDIFRVSWFVQFLLSGIVLCLTGFQMSGMSPKDNITTFFSLLAYQSAMTFMAYMPCKFGNEIIVKSSDLRDAAFACHWPDSDLQFQKKIIMFMEGTKRPLTLYAGKMLELSLRTFSMIINSAYRYYAVLQHMSSLENYS